MKKEVQPRMVHVEFPDLNNLGENDYLVSWRIRDWDHIHHIQKYFGMPMYTNINRISKVTMRRDDPKWNKLIEGIRLGYYRMYRPQNVSKS